MMLKVRLHHVHQALVRAHRKGESMSRFCVFVDDEFNCKAKNKKKECNYTIEDCENCKNWRFWINEKKPSILQKKKQRR